MQRDAKPPPTRGQLSCALDSHPITVASGPRRGGRRRQSSDPGPMLPSGLLRLEELVRGFLISKETLSVRMLDDSRDPTPLLKEIRDDKVSTIIIDANASISHLILRKVGLPLSLTPPGIRGCEQVTRARASVAGRGV